MGVTLCTCEVISGGHIVAQASCPIHCGIAVDAALKFPNRKITSVPGDAVALAERDIYAAAADLMLAAKDMQRLDDVLAAVRKLTGMRAALDSAASFLLTRAEELSNERPR